MKNLEIRSFGGDAAPKIEGRNIDGYALVFNQRSEIMLDWSAEEGLRQFVEIILPTALTYDLLQRSDVKALVEHNRERLLARYNKGKGTLNLVLDEYGLRYTFTAPNTADGDYAVEMVSRGDISGSSFAFRVKNEDTSWVRDGKIWVRTIKKFTSIHDVTITTDPAYTQTEVSVRNLEELEVPEIEEIEETTEPEKQEENRQISKAYKVKIQKLRMNIH